MVLVLITLTVVPLAAADLSNRVVAMGDVHGDLDRLTSILQEAGLIDAELNWVGGETIFVLTGDFTDRGGKVREVMDLLIELQEQSKRAGGEVIVLLGNHEMMNIVGDLRYVAEEAYDSFVDQRSENRQREAFEKTLKIQIRQAKQLKMKAPRETPEQFELWKESHPLGYVEYREAMGPKGKYGRWIRDLPAIVQVGSQVFVHGGIHPNLGDMDIEELQKRIKKERDSFDDLVQFLIGRQLVRPFFTLDEIFQSLRFEMSYLRARAGLDPNGTNGEEDWTYRLRERDRELATIISALQQMGNWLSMHPDGPLWFRGYGRWTEEEGTEPVNKVLAHYGAEHFVVGHTITTERDILRRLGGQVFLIDTVVPVALEIQNGKFTAIYAEGREPVVDHVAASETATVGSVSNPRH